MFNQKIVLLLFLILFVFISNNNILIAQERRRTEDDKKEDTKTRKKKEEKEKEESTSSSASSGCLTGCFSSIDVISCFFPSSPHHDNIISRPSDTISTNEAYTDESTDSSPYNYDYDYPENPKIRKHYKYPALGLGFDLGGRLINNGQVREDYNLDDSTQFIQNIQLGLKASAMPTKRFEFEFAWHHQGANADPAYYYESDCPDSSDPGWVIKEVPYNGAFIVEPLTFTLKYHYVSDRDGYLAFGIGMGRYRFTEKARIEKSLVYYDNTGKIRSEYKYPAYKERLIYTIYGLHLVPIEGGAFINKNLSLCVNMELDYVGDPVFGLERLPQRRIKPLTLDWISVVNMLSFNVGLNYWIR